MMRPCLFILLFLISIFSTGQVTGGTPSDGTIDLRDWHFEEQGAATLNGRWHFQWKHLNEPSTPISDYPNFLSVPGVWNKQSIDQHPLSGFGYGTYRVRVLFNKEHEPLHVVIPELNMAYRLWANGNLIASAGVVGISQDTFEPRSIPKIAALPEGSVVDLVLQISNFYHIEGGIPRALKIDKSETVLVRFELEKLINIFTIGALCIVALHYFALYLGRPEETGHLIYAVLAVLFGLRVLAVSKLPYLIIEHPHIISTRLSYITMFMLPTVYLLFLRSLFPREVSKYLVYSLLFIGISATCWTLITPAYIFTASRDIFSNIILATLLYTMMAALLSVYRQRDDAKLVLLLNTVFVVAAINDTLLYQQLIQSIDMSQYGFLVFIFGHAIVLGRRMNRAYSRENEAHNELSEFAKTLQSRIEERTSDLAEKVGLLQSKEQELALARQLAIDANDAKSRFLAGASHDLKQPMHALSLYTQMLNSSIKKGTSQSVIDNIRASLNNLDTLLDDLIKVSQLEAGSIEPEIREVHLGRCLAGMKNEFKLYAHEKGIEFHYVESSAWVRTDPELLDRIVRNLVSNAIKYTARGKVLIGCRRRRDSITIQVCDTGTGIDRVNVDSIFEEFTRNNTTAVAGSGLGLSIAKSLSEVLDHNLSVTSTPNRGSCFSLSLSRTTALKAPDEIKHPLSLDTHTEALNDLTVLVIDDEVSILKAMSELMVGWGCRVMTASTQSEALAVVERLGCAPDLIVSDYHLQNENGVSVLKQIQEKVRFAIPGVIITADKTVLTSSLADLSYKIIMYKPIDVDLFRNSVVKLLTIYVDEA